MQRPVTDTFNIHPDIQIVKFYEHPLIWRMIWWLKLGSKYEVFFWSDVNERCYGDMTGRHLHGQVLAEFSRTQETELSLRVKSATLWLYVHFKAAQRRLSVDKRPTLYVFRVQHRSLNGTAPDKVLIYYSDSKCTIVSSSVDRSFSCFLSFFPSFFLSFLPSFSLSFLLSLFPSFFLLSFLNWNWIVDFYQLPASCFRWHRRLKYGV